MRRATLVVLLVALALGLTLLWVNLRGNGRGGVSTERGAVVRPPALELADAAQPAAPRVAASAEDSAARTAVAHIAHVDADLVLVAPAWSGRVRERPSGAPIAGALVVLVAGEHEACATSDAQGAFTLACSGAEAALELSHPEYTSLRRAAVDTSIPAVFELERAAALVVHARGPAPAELAVGHARLFELRGDDDHRSVPHEARADDEGRFVFEGLEPGEHALLLEVPGHGFAFDARLVVLAGTRHELALELERGAWLEGRVRFVDGAPARDVTIEVRPERQGLWSELEERVRRESVTADDGSYRLEPLASGAHVVTLTTTWGGETRARIELVEPGRGVQRDFELPRAARIAGVVLDAAGRAVPGAWVALAWEGSDLFVPLDEDGAREDDGRRVTRADAQARFAFEDAPAGRTLRLFARDERPQGDGAAGHVVGLRLSTGEERRELELRLVHSARVTGRALSLAGSAVAFVRVSALRADDERELRLAETRTDEHGAFELRGLPPGDLRLTFEHSEFLEHEEPVQLAERGVLTLDVALAPEPVVRGIVRDAAGFAVPYARVDASCKQPAETRHGRYGKRGTWADRFGRFSFDELGFGTWELAARAVGWRATLAPVVLELPGELWAELELAPDPLRERARVVGTLVDAGGRPPLGVRFSGTRGGALKLVEGRFRLSGAAPGRMRLRIEADRCMPVAIGPFDLAPGGEHDVGLVALRPGTRFTVELRGAGGEKLRTARVRLSPLPVAEGGPDPTPRTIVLEETRPGRYAVQRAALGRYRLRVELQGYERLNEIVALRELPAQDRRVVLARGATKAR